jgi:hypothetical protein
LESGPEKKLLHKRLARWFRRLLASRKREAPKLFPIKETESSDEEEEKTGE